MQAVIVKMVKMMNCPEAALKFCFKTCEAMKFVDDDDDDDDDDAMYDRRKCRRLCLTRLQ